MDRLQLIDDFDLQRSVARQVDDGVKFLDQKLSNIGSFGLSIDPENTRLTAENLLQKYENEVELVKNNVDSCLEVQKQVLDETICNNDEISQFLQQVRNELRGMESVLQKKGNYKLYEPSTENEVADEKEEKSDDEERTNVTQDTIESGHGRELSSTLNNDSVDRYKKFNSNDDILKTPVDPGLSAVTRQVLSKSSKKN